MDRDYIGRQAFNAIFGDRVVASRTPDVLVQFQYGISTRDCITALTGDGAASASSAVATLTAGSSSTGTASVRSIHTMRYQPGFDGYAFFTAAFSASTAGAYQKIGIFDTANGFYIGQVNGEFGYGFQTGGVDTFTPVTLGTGTMKWNEFDPTKINIFRINFGWLGVAPDFFEVYATSANGWCLIGKVEVANTQLMPSIVQPVQPIRAEVGRTSGSGAVTLKTVSWSAGRIQSFTGPLPSDRGNAISANKSGITTEKNVVTIKNATTFASLTNKISSIIDFISASCDGTKPVTIKLKVNATLGGAPSYTDVDASNSVMSYDTAGTTVTGGTQVLSFQLATNGSERILFGDALDIHIMPGDTLTFSATSTNSAHVFIDVRWRELF